MKRTTKCHGGETLPLFEAAILYVIRNNTYEKALDILSAELKLDRARLDTVFDSDDFTDCELAYICAQATKISFAAKICFVSNRYQ